MTGWNLKTRMGLLFGAGMLGCFLWWLFFLRGFGTLVLATGQAGGTYTVLGKGFADFVENADGRFRVETRASEGSLENLRLLEKGEADFAIVQSGQATPDGVRVAAKLYTEVLHILVRSDSPLASLSQLSDLPICLGEEGSGSRAVSLPLLEHFGVNLGNEVSLPPKDALEQLKTGKVDAVFLVTALQSEMIREGVRDDELRFMSLENAVPGLTARFPYLREASVPAMTYRCPSREEGAMPRSEVRTVGIPSLLICRREVAPEVVYEVTKELFASRNILSKLTPEAYQFAEVVPSDFLPWSIHEGAQRYYQRREPGFLERYAEVIALLISFAAASYAVFGAVSRWSSQRKKDRIDEYYLEVAAVFLRLDEELSLESLGEEKSRLRALRSRAFQDLTSERLKADDSFGIFQDQLASCLNDVRRREARFEKI